MLRTRSCCIEHAYVYRYRSDGKQRDDNHRDESKRHAAFLVSSAD
jgi:hypothetical protein